MFLTPQHTKSVYSFGLRLPILLLVFFVHHAALADAVDDYLHKKMQERFIPALQIAIVRSGQIVKTKSYGIANLQDNVPADNDTVFNLASITKAFTAVAVMQLVEIGQVDLSASIADYVNDLPIAWKNVTVLQVLSHTSGLPNIMNERFQLIDSNGGQASWAEVKKRPLKFEPGTVFDYNQTNYVLVDKLVTKVSGKSYAELINDYQLKPAKLNLTAQAGFAHFEDVNHHQARDYRLNHQQKHTNVLTYFPSIIRAGAGMSSNANEMATWAMQLQKGVFFENDTSLASLWAVAPLKNDLWAKANPSMHPYALGWYVVENSKIKKIVATGGGQSAVVIYPELDLTIVILTNLAGATPERFIDEVAEFYIDDFALSDNVKSLKRKLELNEFANTLSIVRQTQENLQYQFNANELHHFANLLVKHQKPEKAQQINSVNNQLHSAVLLSSEVLDSYVGLYQLKDFSIEVSRELDALFIQATGDVKLPVFARSEIEFYLETVDASLRFTKDESGNTSGLTLKLNGAQLQGIKVIHPK